MDLGLSASKEFHVEVCSHPLTVRLQPSGGKGFAPLTFAGANSTDALPLVVWLGNDALVV